MCQVVLGHAQFTAAFLDAIMLVVDVLAYYSAAAGDKRAREQFPVLLRDIIVARGRAAGIVVVAATTTIQPRRRPRVAARPGRGG